MRGLILFGFTCALASVSAQSHDLSVGNTSYGDVMVHLSNEYKTGFPFFVRTTIIEYPPANQPRYAVVKAVYINDKYNDGTGGYPTILDGGVGKRFVKIKLESQRGYGFNFTVAIYGRYS